MLKRDEIRMIDDYNSIINIEVDRMLDQMGITRAMRGDVNGPWYVPHSVTDILDLADEFRKNPDAILTSNPDASRKYADIMDGFDANIRYEIDPRRTLELYLRWAYRKVIKKQFADEMETQGLARTTKEVIGNDIVGRYTGAMDYVRSLSTKHRRVKAAIATAVRHATVALQPIHALIESHVRAAHRLHGDDTTVPLLARGGAKKARLWTYVRDDRPWNGGAPPAAFFRFSRDRGATNPNQHLAGWQGVLQADAYGGYNDLYREDRDEGPVTSALCWSHARRKFFELADIAGNVRKGKPAHQISPVALEAVKRIDAIFDIEREINGLDADARLVARQNLSRPLVNGLHDWLQDERAKLSRHNKVAKAINYMFEKRGRWQAFTAFLDDGHICLTNNAAERALRGVALGRKSWLFAGSERGGERAAAMYTLIVTAKMNDIDPQAWLADVLARLPDLPVSRVHELLPWNWKALSLPQAA